MHPKFDIIREYDIIPEGFRRQTFDGVHGRVRGVEVSGVLRCRMRDDVHVCMVNRIVRRKSLLALPSASNL